VILLRISLNPSFSMFPTPKKKDREISYFSGLSLGEYSCLYPAGVVSLNDLITLVRERSLAMDEAGKENPSGMFAVIGAKEEDLKGKDRDKFYIANMNAPSQIVVSVAEDNKPAVKEEFIEMGFRVVELDVSGGFHSPFMEPARKHLEKVMKSINFSDADIPVVSNVTARAHIKGEEIKRNLIDQLTHPTLWEKCVNFMSEKGVDTFFELGPSRVLKGLIRKINPQLKVISVGKKEDIEKLIAQSS
jgi:[acyl-carrier-protein] S-malonyltransferase